MLVANFTTVRPDMSNTRTYEDFAKFLNDRPNLLGLLSRMYPELTATFLTEALGNVFTRDENKKDAFQSSDSLFFEWLVLSNQIKRVPFAAEPVGNGANGSEIKFQFEENYYQIEEIFKIEESGQQIFVTSTNRLHDKCWEVCGRLVSDSYNEILDASACTRGALTRWIGNAKPELHDIGKLNLPMSAKSLCKIKNIFLIAGKLNYLIAS